MYEGARAGGTGLQPVHASRAGGCHGRGVRGQFSSIPIISNSVSERFGDAPWRSQIRIPNRFVLENLCFSSAGNRFLLFNPIRICFVTLATGAHQPLFLSHVPSETPERKIVAFFSPARARFSEGDIRPEFLRFARRVWCDDSYGAAHMRFWARQKYLKKPIEF